MRQSAYLENFVGEAFNNWTYFYPPRTSIKIPFDDNDTLTMWRNSPDAIGQYKMNGDRNLIAIAPDKTIKMWNRHKEEQKYNIPLDIMYQLQNLATPDKWTVFDSELLHKRTKNVKDCIYIYDILVCDSVKLVGATYEQRCEILQSLGLPYMPLEPDKLTENIYLAENFKADRWDELWASIKEQPVEWCEGLVLKHLGWESRLMAGDRKENNCGGFMCRVRKPKKNYLF